MNLNERLLKLRPLLLAGDFNSTPDSAATALADDCWATFTNQNPLFWSFLFKPYMEPYKSDGSRLESSAHLALRSTSTCGRV